MNLCKRCGQRTDMCRCLSPYKQRYNYAQPSKHVFVKGYNKSYTDCDNDYYNDHCKYRECRRKPKSTPPSSSPSQSANPNSNPPSCPPPCPPKPCNESLSELISSAAEIENAMANAINAEVDLLKRGNLTTEQLIILTNKLENLLKLVIKKEIVLEFLIEDATKACKESDSK
ncbi:hypothetical protein [Metabacillus iocasae]|uniref:Uncharacterized protein n=1 Tax=Priestia iocasae TaxID=2291674 RepID=A0ABS2QYM9_9BACI|nr:hypothetical protein [Metabacillus iocasae]MBM7704348.1 hypothetical protein [Metabacillus iocasae]